MATFSILPYSIALLLDTAAAAFFGITHPSYVGYRTGEDNNVVKTIKMGPFSGSNADPAVANARMMCSRHCAHNTDCWSNYVNLRSSHLYCFLVDSNICRDFLVELDGDENDAINYDKIPDTQTLQSCQDECLQRENGTCEMCNRMGCRQSDCTSCDHSCLDCFQNIYPTLPFTREQHCRLWAGTKNLYHFDITCRGDKFLLFRRTSTLSNIGANVSLVPAQTFGLSTFSTFSSHSTGYLYIELEGSLPNSTLEVFNATYSGFKLGGNWNLWLGAYVDGTAGDGLLVPLVDVSIVTNSSLYDLSCGPFWNISGTYNLSEPTPFGVGPCPGLGTAFWGAPTTTPSGDFQSGIAWATLPQYTITKISVYMF